jgi:hypothetical protein
VKKYVVSTADWKRKMEVQEKDSLEDTIFEVATQAVEWALNSGKSVGILIYAVDPKYPNKNYISLTYKVLINAGFHAVAQDQRALVLEEFGLDLAEGSLNKLIMKLQRAALKKSFCIAKLLDVQSDGRVSKIPVVCINLGLFEDQGFAKERCKELNRTSKDKIFVVRQITYNAFS